MRLHAARGCGGAGMKSMRFGHRNELRAFTEKKLAEDAARADAYVAAVALACCLLYVVLRYFGVVN